MNASTTVGELRGMIERQSGVSMFMQKLVHLGSLDNLDERPLAPPTQEGDRQRVAAAMSLKLGVPWQLECPSSLWPACLVGLVRCLGGASHRRNRVAHAFVAH